MSGTTPGLWNPAVFHCRKSAPPSPRFKAGEGIFAFVEDDANGSLETAHGHGGGPEVLCRLHTWCHGTSLGECDQTVTQYTRHFSILPCSPGQPRPLGKRSPPGSGVADLYGIVSRLGLRVLSVWHVATMPAGSTPRTCSRPSSSSRRWGRALLTSLACDDIVPTQRVYYLPDLHGARGSPPNRLAPAQQPPGSPGSRQTAATWQLHHVALEGEVTV